MDNWDVPVSRLMLKGRNIPLCVYKCYPQP
nr:MAG TPA: hypothetical protein [Caudoviricetes sp.]